MDAEQLIGKTAIVTSSVPGEVEHEIAQNLAARGARVLLLSGKSTADPSNSSIVSMEVDLGSLQSVKDVADTIAVQEERLDLIIGAASIRASKLEDYDANDMEQHMGINYFSHFMLVNRLLPLLRKTSRLDTHLPPRVILLSSEEMQGSPPSDILFSSPTELTAAGCSGFGVNKLHSRAELAKALFVQYGLHKSVLNNDSHKILAIVVNYAAADGKGVGGAVKRMFKKHDKQIQEEVDTVVYAASSADISGPGTFVTKPGKVHQSTGKEVFDELGASLWALSNQIVTEKLGKEALLNWNSD